LRRAIRQESTIAKIAPTKQRPAMTKQPMTFGGKLFMTLDPRVDARTAFRRNFRRNFRGHRPGQLAPKLKQIGRKR